MGKNVDSDPVIIRVCDGCGIENYCSCETESKENEEEEAESIPSFDVEQETKEVAEQFPDLVIEAETVEEELDVETATAQELYDDAVIPIPPENETMSKEEQIRAQIAELEAQLEAKE